MPRPPKTHQFDLFAPPQDGKAPLLPQWQALPEATRQALTRLMTRLLLDHVGDESASQGGEARHDA